MLLQSYDFLHLFDTQNCRMQTAAAPVGNITTGVELVRRMRDQAVYGMVYPLITKSDGTVRKDESGAVWLSRSVLRLIVLPVLDGYR